MDAKTFPKTSPKTPPFDDLIAWSKANFSHLPWRKRRSLYTTLVSEFMLQQTTVAAVLSHFPKFLKRFPNLKSLAEASEEEVCFQWQGLGYYRRARNLHKASRDLRKNHGGRIPLNFEMLTEVSGIGPYTANAILAIGGNWPALALDANLERVLGRLYLLPEPKGPKLKKRIDALFHKGGLREEVRRVGPRAFNESLMDLGRTYCQAAKVDCPPCPVKGNCQAYTAAQGAAPRILAPSPSPPRKASFDLSLLRVVVRKKGKILAYRKSDKEWLSGQLELPTWIVYSEDGTLRQYPTLPALPGRANLNLEGLHSFKSAITKYKMKNYIQVMSEREFREREWAATDSKSESESESELELEYEKRYRFYDEDFNKEHYSRATFKVFDKIKDQEQDYRG